MNNSQLPKITNLSSTVFTSSPSETIGHQHGGQLNEVVKHSTIEKSEWLDLSTGINPETYPCSSIPESVWNRLPENNDDLHQIAAQYYNCESLIAVAGSQIAIQLIPSLFSKSTVGIIQPSYYEHEKHWKKHQHTVVNFQSQQQSNNSQSLLIETINKKIHLLNALLIINPNNPSGLNFSLTQLQKWHAELIKNNAYLIVDEAFMDLTNSQSILSPQLLPNLIVLRSIGKFFGLAGARIGFVFANDKILNEISKRQGPWPISGPSRWLAGKALADKKWQLQTQQKLKISGARLIKLLNQYSLHPTGGTDLFQWLQTDKAEIIHKQLLEQAVLTRLFHNPLSIRFGLPKNESQWQKLHYALKQL